MKKLLWFALAALAAGILGWLPAQPRDVGALLPVEALVLREENGRLLLDGGENLLGTGETWAQAVENLRETAPGDAFFGTVGHIVLVEDAQEYLLDVLDDREMRPAARVYLGVGDVDAAAAARFLDAHRGGVTIQDLQAAVLEDRETTLPRLREENGRYRLEDG